ncbi:MAG: phosphatidylserine decarboxylase [Holosporales bacterium]|jgi:phosphatidylserine decarboxylase|nr:phosphatidylserine decarboxylase [Holosporales bacterium]
MSISMTNFSIHNDGVKFVVALAATSLVFMTFSSTLGWIFVFLTIFCAFFFRNPKRAVIDDENLIVSPADGTVSTVCIEVPPSDIGLGDEPRYRVSIFLSIFNVHVNRIPFAGTIKSIFYNSGSFLNASLDKSSLFNEKNVMVLSLKTDPDKMMAFTQTAGMLARRIVCDVHEGEEVKKGDIFGIIRFGSRCDVWLPIGVLPKVIKGQTMIAGESVIADIASTKTELPTGKVI